MIEEGFGGKGYSKMAKIPEEHEDPALTLLSLQQGQPAAETVVIKENHLSNVAPIAKLEGREFEYLVRQNKISIGRNSKLCLLYTSPSPRDS